MLLLFALSIAATGAQALSAASQAPTIERRDAPPFWPNVTDIDVNGRGCNAIPDYNIQAGVAMVNNPSFYLSFPMSNTRECATQIFYDEGPPGWQIGVGFVEVSGYLDMDADIALVLQQSVLDLRPDLTPETDRTVTYSATMGPYKKRYVGRWTWTFALEFWYPCIDESGRVYPIDVVTSLEFRSKDASLSADLSGGFDGPGDDVDKTLVTVFNTQWRKCEIPPLEAEVKEENPEEADEEAEKPSKFKHSNSSRKYW